MEKRYLVKWEIDQWANSPEEAIKKAILDMPHAGSDSVATVFDVQEIDENGKLVKTFQIDVEEKNSVYTEEEMIFAAKEILKAWANKGQRNKLKKAANTMFADQLAEWDEIFAEVQSDIVTPETAEYVINLLKERKLKEEEGDEYFNWK